MTERMWKIMAGEGGELVQDFMDKNIVAIGWNKMGDYSKVKLRMELHDLYKKSFPEDNRYEAAQGIGSIYRFLNEIQVT
jgi:restriction system protein